MSDLDELLDEQVSYYRARAPEYDATAPAYDPASRLALRDRPRTKV